MRKLLWGPLCAAALGVSTNANAATVAGSLDPINDVVLNNFLSENFGETQWVDKVGLPFTTSFTFNLWSDYSANAQVSSKWASLTDIDFTSILLDGFAFTQTGFDNNTETWELLFPVTLLAGSHTITVNGTVQGTNRSGSYVGNINIAPVPEPVSWGMMLLGFGAIGYAMRRRRRPALVQIA